MPVTDRIRTPNLPHFGANVLSHCATDAVWKTEILRYLYGSHTFGGMMIHLMSFIDKPPHIDNPPLLHFSAVPLQIKLTFLYKILSKNVPTARLKNGQPLFFKISFITLLKHIYVRFTPSSIQNVSITYYWFFFWDEFKSYKIFFFNFKVSVRKLLGCRILL